MARKDVDLVIRAKDEAASVVDRITKAINDFTDAQSDLGPKASKTESVFGRLGAAIAGLDKAIRAVSQTKEGDRLRLEFTASGSTRVVFNDREMDTVTGGGLARAMPRIWLGHSPAQESMKKGMLGL